MFDKLSKKSGGAFSPRLLRLVALLAAGVLRLALALAFPDARLRLRGDMLWNVLLSALPLVFALLLFYCHARGRRGAANVLFGLLWLCFFPNAPYMVTGFIHLDHYVFWADGAFVPSLISWLGLAHITLAIGVGLYCGWLSLYLVHSVLGQRGRRRGWLFCSGACLLAGTGITIGRFLRFNSWDLFTRPLAMLDALWGLPWWHTLLLCLLFAAVTFGGYLLFYASCHVDNTKQDTEKNVSPL